MCRHEAPDLPAVRDFVTDVCNICKKDRVRHFDDFYGYLCTVCWIKHPLARTTNPYTGAKLYVVKKVHDGSTFWLTETDRLLPPRLPTPRSTPVSHGIKPDI
jgi:hypothetical protein